eukprot:766865-Hanusia_phi.AAC.3
MTRSVTTTKVDVVVPVHGCSMVAGMRRVSGRGWDGEDETKDSQGCSKKDDASEEQQARRSGWRGKSGAPIKLQTMALHGKAVDTSQVLDHGDRNEMNGRIAAYRRYGKLMLARSANGLLQPERRAPVRMKRFYSSELDSDFFRASFDSYVVSKTVKKRGGGQEGLEVKCGGMHLGLRECFWINKQVYEGTGSGRRLQEKNLLYLGSRDGFFNATFHRAVDVKGPTLTLVLLADSRTFGGFASVSWRSGSRGHYCEDPLAFLFVLTDGQGKKRPVKIAQKSASTHAVFHDADLGPCFGRALALQLDILALSSSDVSASSYRVPPGESIPFSLGGAKTGWDVREVAVWRV